MGLGRRLGIKPAARGPVVLGEPAAVCRRPERGGVLRTLRAKVDTLAEALAILLRQRVDEEGSELDRVLADLDAAGRRPCGREGERAARASRARLERRVGAVVRTQRASAEG